MPDSILPPSIFRFLMGTFRCSMNSFQWHIVKLKHRALLSSLIVAAAFIPFSSTTAGTANPPTIQKTPELARQVNETLNFDHKTEDILKTLTESKNPSDKTLMGAFYGSGAGGKQDWGKARMWFEKAASEGDAHAEYFLGLLYMGVWAPPKIMTRRFIGYCWPPVRTFPTHSTS